MRVGSGVVRTLLLRPRGADAVFVMAHGAGAPMEHPFLEALASALAVRRLATLRFNFPYAEARRRLPDAPAVLSTTLAAAVARAARLGLPIVCGGKSMGGRVASQCLARGELPQARGVVFLGFPLHPARKPGVARAAHLVDVVAPKLFLQGDRDDLADLTLLRGVVADLPDATLLEVAGANHAFDVPKRSGRTSADVVPILADSIAAFARRVGPPTPEIRP